MISNGLERASRFAIALSLMAVAAAWPAAAAAEATLALVGGRVIDGYGGTPLERAVVLIENDRIVAVDSMDRLQVPAGAEVLDFSGMTALPGLWESHGHLFHAGAGKPTEFQQTFAGQAKEVMAAVAKTSLMAGITSFRDTGGPLELQLELRRDIQAGRLPGPRLFLAGPILHQGQGSGTDEDYYVNSPREARSAVERLARAGVDQVKVYGFWDLEILKAVVDAAHAAGLGVDADVRHRRAYITAVQAGVDRLHHVFAADPLSDYSDEDLRLLIGGWEPGGFGPSANIIRGPFILPTVEMRKSYVRAFEFPGLLDHPRLRNQYSPEVYAYLKSTWEHPTSIPWGIGAPERVKVIERKLGRFVEAGGREQLVAGTDAGSPFNLHSPLPREIRRLHEAGLTPMEAIQAATLRPAQMQGVADELGTISPGKLADLIIVNGDPLQDLSLLEHEVLVVIKGGRTWFPDHNFPGRNGGGRD